MRQAEDGQAIMGAAEWPLLEGLSAEGRATFLACLEPVCLAGGETLFARGDPADALYLVASGVIGVSIEVAGTTRRLARIGPPETVGEMALISDAPRSADAVALRDALLLRLPRDAFADIARRWPAVMLYLARLLSERLRRSDEGGPVPVRSSIFALVPITDGIAGAALARALARELAGVVGPRVAALDGAPDEADETFFHALEREHDAVVYGVERADTPWGRRALRRADHIVYLARPGQRLRLPDRPAPSRAAAWRRRDLVILQDASAAAPAPVEASAAELPVELTLHCRLAQDGDLARVARLLAGRAFGVVLSGGGARGFAHIGVLRALAERVPIDLVGGTSIGAVIAASWAMGWSIDEIGRRVRAALVDPPALNDYTLPIVGLVRGGRVDAQLARHFGGVLIENLWLPFFCVSSNLTTGRMNLHARGSLQRALRASIAIPGILPPLVDGEGVHADGAMLNNLPADVMADLQRGPVLAVDVARDFALSRGGDRPASLLRRLLGIPAEVPNIATILMRAATISSDSQAALARSRASAVITPPLASIGLRDWRAFERAIEIGYRHAERAIADGLIDGLTKG